MSLKQVLCWGGEEGAGNPCVQTSNGAIGEIHNWH